MPSRRAIRDGSVKPPALPAGEHQRQAGPDLLRQRGIGAQKPLQVLARLERADEEDVGRLDAETRQDRRRPGRLGRDGREPRMDGPDPRAGGGERGSHGLGGGGGIGGDPVGRRDRAAHQQAVRQQSAPAHRRGRMAPRQVVDGDDAGDGGVQSPRQAVRRPPEHVDAVARGEAGQRALPPYQAPQHARMMRRSRLGPVDGGTAGMRLLGQIEDEVVAAQRQVPAHLQHVPADAGHGDGEIARIDADPHARHRLRSAGAAARRRRSMPDSMSAPLLLRPVAARPALPPATGDGPCSEE